MTLIMWQSYKANASRRNFHNISLITACIIVSILKFNGANLKPLD